LNIYILKRRFKWTLFVIGIAIVCLSLWYTNNLVKKIAKDERRKITTWAETIHRKASLVNYTNDFFVKIQQEERHRVELLAEATKKLINASSTEDITFYSEIIADNTSIPVVLTDEKGKILSTKNVDFNESKVRVMNDSLRKQFTIYKPIKFSYFGGNKNYFYYKDSRLFSDLRKYLDDLVKSFFSEVALNSASVPVIITDSSMRNVIESGNLDAKKMRDSLYVRHTLAEMAAQNDPISITIKDVGVRYIFYKDSYLLTQLRYYPYVQFVIIGLFLLIAYQLFSWARRSEQNQVWAGLAKETAHQLGTPLSSIMAWVELLKLSNVDRETITELSKDVNRLHIITERFSKIGSATILKPENIVSVIYESVEYLKLRTSKKVTYSINPGPEAVIFAPINLHLFEWVIENLCKNAVDAISGKGLIAIDITEQARTIVIDVSDTGKGIQKSKFKSVFQPGFTSKQRGWGLGLSLSRRIIKEYHRGKIFVQSSTLEQGTTFRIILRKKMPKKMIIS